MEAMNTVSDTFRRGLRDLRISVTDRCNFRCCYCMPRDVFGTDFPFMKTSELLTFEEIAPNFWRAAARYGFMERPDIPGLLRQAHERGCTIDLSDITYYVGHETVVPGDDAKALPRVVEALFAFMQRNSSHLTDYFKLPVDAVVEIGREVSI